MLSIQLFPLKQKNATCVKSLVIEGVCLNSDQEIAQAFNNHFTTVGNKIDDSLPVASDQYEYLDYVSTISPTNSFYFSPISPSDVNRVIHLMENKSTHIDTYSIKIIKYLSEIISPILTKIINRSFEVGQFPQICKTARVVPIYKADDPTDVNNYRPILILPIFSKIFEKIVHNKLYSFLKRNRLLSGNQYMVFAKTYLHLMQ